MVALVERHLKAQGEGDAKGAVAVYTDDVVHDAVGFPGSPRTRKGAARAFYVFLTAHFRTEEEAETLHRCFAGDTMTPEPPMTLTASGQMPCVPCTGCRVSS